MKEEKLPRKPTDNIIYNIKEEHENRTKWMDEKLTIRQRARIERQVALKVGLAFLIYLFMMWIMSIYL